MNYRKIYKDIVKYYKELKLPYKSKGTHRHHIKARATFDANTPKSIVNDPRNLVVVPYCIHFVLHRLYSKFEPTMRFAAWMLANGKNNNEMKITSRVYELLAREQAEVAKETSLNLWQDEGYRERCHSALREANGDKTIYHMLHIRTKIHVWGTRYEIKNRIGKNIGFGRFKICNQNTKKNCTQSHGWLMLGKYGEEISEKEINKNLFWNSRIKKKDIKRREKCGRPPSDITHTFVNKITSNVYIGTSFEFGKKYVIDAGTMHNLIKKQLPSIHGWVYVGIGNNFTENEINEKKNKPHGSKGVPKDKRIMNWKNKKSGEVFTGIRLDFINRFNLNEKSVQAVLCGRLKSTGSWLFCGYTL